MKSIESFFQKMLLVAQNLDFENGTDLRGQIKDLRYLLK